MRDPLHDYRPDDLCVCGTWMEEVVDAAEGVVLACPDCEPEAFEVELDYMRDVADARGIR